MSFTEEEKKKALQLYDETGSIAKVIHKLGYPSRQNMYTWIKNRDIEKKRKKYGNCSDHKYLYPLCYSDLILKTSLFPFVCSFKIL